MKKGMIFKILAIITSAFLVIAFFGDVWMFEMGESSVEGFGLFDKFPNAISDAFRLGGKTFQPVWAYITSALAVAALAFVAIIIVVTVLDMFKAGNKKLKQKAFQISTFALLLSSVIMFASMFVFTSNHASYQVPPFINIDVYMMATINTYFLLAGSLLPAILSLFAFEGKTKTKKKAKKKSKKK